MYTKTYLILWLHSFILLANYKNEFEAWPPRWCQHRRGGGCCGELGDLCRVKPPEDPGMTGAENDRSDRPRLENCFLKKLTGVRKLTTFYLAKSDHRWVKFISLKTINSDLQRHGGRAEFDPSGGRAARARVVPKQTVLKHSDSNKSAWIVHWIHNKYIMKQTTEWKKRTNAYFTSYVQ